MANETQMPTLLQKTIDKTFSASSDQLLKLVKSPFLRNTIIREAERFMKRSLKKSLADPNTFPGIAEDRTAMSLGIIGSMERALQPGRLSDSYLDGVLHLLVKTLFIDRGDMNQRKRFEAEFGQPSPSFILVSPTKACNLHCIGCYADSDQRNLKLEWDIVDRLVDDAKTLWGDRFIVISGGEPFAYKSNGKTIVDLFEEQKDCFFMVYTNSTLITEEISKRLSRAGNVLLCISVEGWKKRTDERRGEGVFDKILQAMELLKNDGVPFGISLTATRYNAEEILSDEFIDYFIDKGALFAWLFQYMPIGRAFTLDLMVTPEQRVWMWKRSWEIVHEYKFFLADFWNHGTTVDGCLSAGGHGNGGYFHIDWNGAVSPCVFVPYSPVNIKDIYANGGNLNDVWKHPFFQSIRDWQCDYKNKNRNGLTPCPNRDHHDELEVLLRKYEPEPTDANAAETLTDPEYTQGLVAYNRKLEALTKNIWETHYLHRKTKTTELFSPLPEIPLPKVEEEIKEKKEEVSFISAEELPTE